MQLAVAITALIFAVMAFTLAVWNLIQNEALKKSTHSVQFVPAQEQTKTDENGFEVLDDKTRMALENDDLEFDPLYEDTTQQQLRPEFLKKKAELI